MRVHFVVLGLFLLAGGVPVYSQTDTFSHVEEQVYQLNNQLKYRESQALLLPILQSQAFSADKKYKTAVLLSYTYKRLLDYQSALKFLTIARQFINQTTHIDQYTAGIASEEAFIHFDIHHYQKADSLMTILAKTDFKWVNLENKSKLIMQQGYLLFLNRKYAQAEQFYDRAIGAMRASSPCDLPMIYVKKMQLYDAVNQLDLMRNAFRLSGRCADSCGIIKYHIYAADELLKIYARHNDLPRIASTKRRLDSLNTIYAQAENIAALHDQKEAILLGAKDRELETGKYNQTYLTIIIMGMLLILALLLTWLVIYRRRQRTMEAEFVRMEAELKTYLTSIQPAATVSATPPVNVNDIQEFSALSERQQTVLTYLMEGLTNHEIGDRLCVSENTVKYHIKNIYQLLAIKGRKELFINLRK